MLVAAAGVGLLGSAAFVTDPVSGYPPGTPDLLTPRTTPGLLHDLFGVPTFLGLPAAEAVDATAFWRLGHRTCAVYPAGSSAAMVVRFGPASAAFAQTPALMRFGGLLQRSRRKRLRLADRSGRGRAAPIAPVNVRTVVRHVRRLAAWGTIPVTLRGALRHSSDAQIGTSRQRR